VLILHRGVLVCLCIAEILSIAAIGTLYRAAEKPDTASFLWSRPGILLLCLVAGIVISLCGAAYQPFTVRTHDLGRCSRTVVVSVVAFVGVLTLGEVGVRAFVTETLRGPVLSWTASMQKSVVSVQRITAWAREHTGLAPNVIFTADVQTAKAEGWYAQVRTVFEQSGFIWSEMVGV
jgi:hypothetical protein